MLNIDKKLQSRPDLLVLINTIAQDKGLPVSEIFEATEIALQKIANIKYGVSYDIRASIDRNTGSVSLLKAITVVEEVEDFYKQISLKDAQQQKADAQIGDEIVDLLPMIDFERNELQQFRQIIFKRIKESEKDKEYNFYKEKIGELITGTVRRIEYGNYFVEIAHRIEGCLKKKNCLPREYLEIGDKIKTLIIDVVQDYKAPQIHLSRYDKRFIEQLFIQEIPEVYDGSIVIKGIARDPRSRSKVMVYSEDRSIDPVAVCIGFKGHNINNILADLKGERIDLIKWSENFEELIQNAFKPLTIVKSYYEDYILSVVIHDEDFSAAIGRGGQNINLISKLIGMHINLVKESEYKELRKQALTDRIEFLKNALDIDEMIAQLLVIEGFKTAEDILDKQHNLTQIAAFDHEIIEELIDRSQDYLSYMQEQKLYQLQQAGVEQALIDNFGISVDELLILAKHKILTVSNLADLDVEELLTILPNMANNEEQLGAWIMQARTITA